MNREEKAEIIKLLHEDFNNKPASFIVNYRGLTVTQMQELRKTLRANGGSLRVAKARLMKRAADGINCVQDLIPFFKDQIGLVFVDQEAPTVAKVLHTFAKDNEALELVAGCFESTMLDKDMIVRIASLPTREVLLAQVCGTMKAPINSFAMVLRILLMRLLIVLKKIEEQKSK